MGIVSAHRTTVCRFMMFSFRSNSVVEESPSLALVPLDAKMS